MGESRFVFPFWGCLAWLWNSHFRRSVLPIEYATAIKHFPNRLRFRLGLQGDFELAIGFCTR